MSRLGASTSLSRNQERQLVLSLGPGVSRVRPGPLVSKSKEVLGDYGDVSAVPEATLQGFSLAKSEVL